MDIRNPVLVVSLAWILGGAAVLGGSGVASAALEKPSYAAGDRWVYTLEGSLQGLPDMEDTGDFALTLVGRVEVDVNGVSERTVGGTAVRVVQVSTRVTGFLNGTFSVPDGLPSASVSVSGTFASVTQEVWEDEGYFAIESQDTTTYVAEVFLIITATFEVAAFLNATTTVVQDGTFPLDVGENASASLETELTVNSTATVFGQTTTVEDTTNLSSIWRREVLALESVAVEAGTFSAYRLNQSLGFFPGLSAAGSPIAGYETAHFSNDVGYYVKRVAYSDGAPVAELRLKSYTYQAAGSPFPLSALEIGLLGTVAVVALALAVWIVRRRRRRAEPPGPPTGGPGRQGGG